MDDMVALFIVYIISSIIAGVITLHILYFVLRHPKLDNFFERNSIYISAILAFTSYILKHLYL